MKSKSVPAQQIIDLKRKLDNAIQSRSAIEEDFSAQSQLLIQFINKLSLVSKGVDLELDNKLAQLRILFTKSAPLSDIECKISTITKLLHQHSITNEHNINQMHKQFTCAGESLQKLTHLPESLRLNLQLLLKNTESNKDSLIQYIPLLSQLITLYDCALSEHNTSSKQEMLAKKNTDNTTNNIKNQLPSKNTCDIIDKELMKKVSGSLSVLHLSTEHKKTLDALKKKISTDKSNTRILKHLVEIFDLIVADLNDEKNNAKKFLTNLSDTLTKVQVAVKDTLTTHKNSQKANEKINKKLQKQLVDMTGAVEKALSLDQIKLDISKKLQLIAGTIEQKSKFEQQNQQVITKKISEMSTRVAHLENQSKAFEDKLAAQQLKSMQDALTKLANRAAFDEYFSKAMVRFHHKPYDLALVVIDIDNFKSINDTYGHSAGDKTLQVIANTIQKHVHNGTFIARYGGEEFVLIYSDFKKETLIKELNNINTYIARLPFKFKNTKVSITLSLGASHIKPDDNIHTAFERADQAMYQAKAQGKNQVIYIT